MNGEVKAAAERLRGFDADCLGGWVGSEKAKEIAADVRTLLAEHPADDDVPVTEEWLKSQGVAFNSRGVNAERPKLWRLLFVERAPCDYLLSIPAELLPTRQSVRLLLRALGVEVRA